MMKFKRCYFFYEFSLDEDEMRLGVGFSGNVGCSSIGPNMGVDVNGNGDVGWSSINNNNAEMGVESDVMLVLILEFKWILMMMKTMIISLSVRKDLEFI